jgi:hypothetical protein
MGFANSDFPLYSPNVLNGSYGAGLVHNREGYGW